jgi:hypothetical protein
LKRVGYLLSELDDVPPGTPWEAKLSGTMALLRSVGHVLDKTDGSKGEPELRRAIDAHWSKLNQGKNSQDYEIFWEFIEEERNLILKEGDVRTDYITMIPGFGAHASAHCGGETPPGLPEKPAKARQQYYLTEGPYHGRDPRLVIREAIEWWENYLDAIEKDANAAPP